MSRRILDCKTMEIGKMTVIRERRLNKKLDRLGVPKDATVQVNLGTKEELTGASWKEKI